ncbi:hypothetical protein AB0A98_06300 [Streptomyces chrestomyceticus]|uniref:hypothetical protein n=1 Tax=Streptomyces chrestomyceticus TaxID=68185 RepID=UPI0033EB0312
MPNSRVRIHLVGKRGETTVTLHAGAFETRCDHYDKPTLVIALRHTDISGWMPKPGARRGARFVKVASDFHRNIPDDLH